MEPHRLHFSRESSPSQAPIPLPTRRAVRFLTRPASEVENQLAVPKRRAQAHPIEAECCGSSSACALLDSTKKVSLWLACALQGQNAVQ